MVEWLLELRDEGLGLIDGLWFWSWLYCRNNMMWINYSSEYPKKIYPYLWTFGWLMDCPSDENNIFTWCERNVAMVWLMDGHGRDTVMPSDHPIYLRTSLLYLFFLTLHINYKLKHSHKLTNSWQKHYMTHYTFFVYFF